MKLNHIKRYKLYENEKIDFQNLIFLFSEMVDEWRNISIQVGEYFKSQHYLLKDLINKTEDTHDIEYVTSYLENNKPFIISVQLKPGNDRLEDSIYVLNWINDNRTQIEFFGYKLANFYIKEVDLVQINYIPK